MSRDLTDEKIIPSKKLEKKFDPFFFDEEDSVWNGDLGLDPLLEGLEGLEGRCLVIGDLGVRGP